MSWKVFITRKIPEAGIQMLEKEGFRVELYPEDHPIPTDLLKEKIENIEALIPLLTDKLDNTVLRNARNLKIIANYAVGYNNIDLDYTTERKIYVSNTPGVLTDATADLTWALIFSTARRIVESDRFMRSGKFIGWAPLLFLGADIAGRTLGIIGGGRIGTAVAQRAAGFNMKVLYYDTEEKEEMNKTGAQKAALDDLLRESDFISLHVPLTAQTHHLISRREFGLMKKSAIIVNTSRGPVIEESELVKALKEGKIAAAGLDVFEHEPRLAAGLADLDNVVILPHTGSATLETRTKMAVIAAQNIIECFRGNIPPNKVNN